MMEAVSVQEIAGQLLAQARDGRSGRAARTVYGGHEHELRQTVIALQADHELAEHESPGEATLQVLVGRVRLTADSDAWELATGDLIAIPPRRHGLTALQDAAVLLTVRVGG